MRTVISRLVKKLRSRPSPNSGLSLTERSTITLLDQNKEMLPTELAAAEKITTQSMSQVLNHLLELGYINRGPSPTDGRKVFISLSKEGKAALYKSRSDKDEWLAKALHETCTAREQELLHRALAPLTKLVDFE